MPIRNNYKGGRINRDVAFPIDGVAPVLADGKDCVGLWTGERRAPREGEWYIARGKAHCAQADVRGFYAIARIYPVMRTGLIEIAAFPIDRL